MNKQIYNTEEDQVMLEEVLMRIKIGTLSFRGGARFLTENTGKKITHEGLRKIYNKNGRADNQPTLDTEPTGISD